MNTKDSPVTTNNGNPVFSLATCLMLAWRTLAKLHDRVIDNTSVAFKNIQFKKYLPEVEENQLEVTILPGSGNFEICSDKDLIVDGNIKLAYDVHSEQVALPVKYIEKHQLKGNDIYKELTKRGYVHADSTKCMKSSDIATDVGYITWKDWASFLNAIFIFDVLKKDTRDLYLPKSIERIVIDVDNHTVVVNSSSNVTILNHKNIGVISAGGVQVANIKWNLIPRRVNNVEFDMYALVNKNNVKVDEVKKQLNNARLVCSPTWNLSSLHWVESPRLEVTPDMELCHVYYTGLNYQDFAFASGRELRDDLHHNLEDRFLGMEFSGRTTTGKRVMGVVQNGLTTDVLADKRFLWEVPSNWSLDNAATVPVAFSTAYYALFVRGQLKPNQSVVIYHGCSDVGYAAIRLALHCGCKVFATYETRNHKGFISSRFLEVLDSMNGYHWDPTFEKKVLGSTDGKGADLILNLLEFDKAPAALSCLAKGGKFLDLVYYGKNLGSNLSTLGSNQSYHSINMNTITDAEKNIVSDLLTEGIRTGDVYPIYSDCYTNSQIVEAFESFAAVDRVGKIVVRIRKEETSEDEVTTILAAPQIYMKMDKTYILIGGPEDIVIDLCFWLISRGATKLVLVPAHYKLSSYQLWYNKRWSDRGIDVVIPPEDTSTQEGVKHFLKQAMEFGNIDGIFDLSTVLLEENVSKDVCEKNIVRGIEILEEMARELAPNLTHFVLLTSKSNQMTRDSLIKIVHKRKRDSLPGVVVQIELIDSTEHKAAGERIPNDISLETIRYIIQDLDKLLVQPYDMVTVKSK